MKGWQRRFDDPITVNGLTLRTLRDAADYIVALKFGADRDGLLHPSFQIMSLIICSAKPMNKKSTPRFS